MDASTKETIRKEIEASTIPEWLKLLNVMAASVRLLSEQAFERMKSIYIRYGYKLNSNDFLSGLNQYCDMERRAAFLFSQRIDPMITQSTFDLGGVEQYDNFNSDCNELIRLLMMFIDRCSRDEDACREVFAALERQTSKGIYSDADIERFNF